MGSQSRDFIDDSEICQILSLDGGGIKGLYSAALLSKLEEDLKIKITDYFDLIAGTSTGGLVALGLGMGMSPLDMVEFYKEYASSIFPQKPIFTSAKQFVLRKYNSKNLKNALLDCFKTKTLGDSKKRLVIPSYNLGDNDVYIFKTPHYCNFRRDSRVPTWMVGMATTAAPTYFNSFKEIDGMRLVDGGIWANNPAMVSLTEALTYLEYGLSQIKIFSIGTSFGLSQRSSWLDWGGKMVWASSAVDVVTQAQSQSIDKQLGLILKEKSYHRVNPAVPLNYFKLDKLSINELIARASHDSRDFSKIFVKKFGSHNAKHYKPFNLTPNE